MTELEKAIERLSLERSRFGAAIRAGQMAGMTPRLIGEVVGLKSVVVRQLIQAWGLDT